MHGRAPATSGNMAGMQLRKSMSRSAALAFGAALMVAACGEVVRGPAEAPEAAQPANEDAEIDEITEGEIARERAGTTETEDEQPEEEADDGPPDTEGAKVGAPRDTSRDLSEIAALVKQHRQPVRQCYEEAAKKQPGLQGTMVIHFEVDPEGNVSSARLAEERSQVKVPELVNCAINVIKSIKFPASAKGMISEVNYPYTFKPKR
jgi:TonB family protein